MSNRPEYIRCVHQGETGQSYCGRKLWGFDKAFLDIEHAQSAIDNRDRLVPCRDCMAAAKK